MPYGSENRWAPPQQTGPSPYQQMLLAQILRGQGVGSQQQQQQGTQQPPGLSSALRQLIGGGSTAAGSAAAGMGLGGAGTALGGSALFGGAGAGGAAAYGGGVASAALPGVFPGATVGSGAAAGASGIFGGGLAGSGAAGGGATAGGTAAAPLGPMAAVFAWPILGSLWSHDKERADIQDWQHRAGLKDVGTDSSTMVKQGESYADYLRRMQQFSNYGTSKWDPNSEQYVKQYYDRYNNEIWNNPNYKSSLSYMEGWGG